MTSAVDGSSVPYNSAGREQGLGASSTKGIGARALSPDPLPLRGDEVSLSGRGRELLSSAESTTPLDQAANASSGKSLFGGVGGLISKALGSLRSDLSQALHNLGLEEGAVKNFGEAFIQPFRDALRSGESFHAELSFSSFTQTTTAGASFFSQESSLVAKSIEIDVNRETGEVSVSFAELSIEQKVLAVGPQAGPGASLPPLPELKAEDEKSLLEEILLEARERLAAITEELFSSVQLRELEDYEDEKGDAHTRLVLDAAVPLPPLAEETLEGAGLDLSA